MGFYATDGLGGTVCECREKTHPPSKNRVVGSRRFPSARARLSAPQTLEPHREKQPTPTTTASGVRFYGYRYYKPEIGRWVNRDPIEEIFLKQGLFSNDACIHDLYLFAANVPVNSIDLYGLHAVTRLRFEFETEYLKFGVIFKIIPYAYWKHYANYSMYIDVSECCMQEVGEWSKWDRHLNWKVPGPPLPVTTYDPTMPHQNIGEKPKHHPEEFYRTRQRYYKYTSDSNDVCCECPDDWWSIEDE